MAHPGGESPQESHKTAQKELEEEMSKWELRSSEIKIESEIGRGSFGIVYKGKVRGKEVAVKKLFDSKDDFNIEIFRREVGIMSTLKHPNLLLFIGACTEPAFLMFVTELMPRGSVYDILHDEKLQLSMSQRMKMAKDVANGMNWLHMRDPIFIHRDLKSANLLVDQNWNVKVSDFGLSYIKQSSVSERGNFGSIGTPLWMAPEVLLNKSYNESADLYSFGIVLWELLTRHDPFPNIDNFDTMVQSVCVNKERPIIPDDCPPTLKKLITDCWSPQPEARPTFSELLRTNVFDKVIIESTLHDENGRKFWEHHFLDKEIVHWDDFGKAFCQFWKMPTPAADNTHWKCFKAVAIQHGKDDMVTMEKFCKVLDWFGPMNSAQEFLQLIEDVLKLPYFHGEMSVGEAEKVLKDEKKKSFMVRFSLRIPGCFSLSLVDEDGKVRHKTITHSPGTHFIIGETFDAPNIAEIVIRYGNQLALKFPYPDSPYAYIFQKGGKEDKKVVIED